MKEEVKTLKQEYLFTSDLKLKYCGYGEWVEEEDLLSFEYLGYEAKIVRAFFKEPYCKKETYFGGHLCGYVKIPEDHPYFGREDIDIDCHWGVTFTEVEKEHWIGFDCAHSGDYVPTIEKMMNENRSLDESRGIFKPFSIFTTTYKNINYCIEECKKMIRQLISIKEPEQACQGKE